MASGLLLGLLIVVGCHAALGQSTGGNATTSAASSSCAVDLLVTTGQTKAAACALVFPGVSNVECGTQAQNVNQSLIATADPACIWPIPEACLDVQTKTGEELDSCPGQTVAVVFGLAAQGTFTQPLNSNQPFADPSTGTPGVPTDELQETTSELSQGSGTPDSSDGSSESQGSGK